MKTALITGASEGIGLEFAKLCAKNGISLILVARNQARLETIAKELSVNKIEVNIYAKDLSILDNAKFIYNDLKSKNISIDYLFNNAGFGINGNYIDIEWQREMDMLTLNMVTLAYFTKVFAKDMVARNFGRILNIGSTGSFQAGPYMAGYCASKAFVLSLSEAVNYELKGTDVSVTALCPGVTDSKFHMVAQTGTTLMSKMLTHATPAQVAKYGFKLMTKGKAMGIYGFSNKIMIFMNRIISRRLMTAMAAMMLRSK